MIVHLDGRLCPLAEARISPFDRGFLFGDGIYEGLRSAPDAGSITGARIIGLNLHVRRMQSGLDRTGVRWDAAAIGPASLALLKANGLTEAFIYWQVTRGVPPPGTPVRSRVPPASTEMKPTVFGYCTPQPALFSMQGPPVKRAVTCPDIRWQMGHLKSISLMGNVLTAMEADGRGGEEAIMIRGGLVSEGLATNVVLASAHGLSTPSLTSVPILEGVTRSILLRVCPEIQERAVPCTELAAATEVMLIGTTTLVTSVTHLDGRPVGDGRPGPAAKRLFQALLDAISTRRDE